MPSYRSTSLSRRRGAISSRALAALAVTISVIGAVAYSRRDRVCCAPAPLPFIATVERPADLWIDLETQTGSVSPEYFHRYRLRLSSNGAAVVTYSPGYGQDAPSWTAAYALSADTLDSLWADFRDRRFWTLPPERKLPDDQVPVGGGSTVLTVFAGGQFVVLTNERRDQSAVRVRDYIKRVHALVPDSLLQAFKARQAGLPRR